MSAAAPRAAEEGPAWKPLDKLAVVGAWVAGITLCLLAGSIVVYMAYRGIQYLQPELLTTHPVAGSDQSQTGGFLDPLLGTVILTILGTVIAAPVGIGVAVWLTEYGRPAGLARAVESGVEIVAGTPSIVLAIFGLLIFQQSFFGFLSFTAEGSAVFGRSFFAAGAMMSLIALPLIIGATRETLNAIPSTVREASYSLGKDRASTIRRILLPAARPGIATGITLGMGRIIGDTAIVVILLGASLQLQGVGNTPVIGDLRGTGSTMTSYVYNNSPAGEGNAPQKAYAAAFVLLLIVIALNFIVELIARRSGGGAARAATMKVGMTE
ncbi:MAG: PstA family ABC transporter permease [Vicinamibacteria bacterium]|jgi:phosphate transport system permease protein